MKCVSALLIAGAVSGTALASEIPYDSFTGTVINFDSMAGAPTLGAGERLGTQFSGQGVTFDVPSFGAFAANGLIATGSLLNTDPDVIWVDQGGGLGEPGLGMNILFSTPIHRIGTLFMGSSTGTLSLAVYNGDTLLETLTKSFTVNPNFIQEGFAALERSENITRAVVFATNGVGTNWNFSIDDLKFTTAPAPSASAVLALAGLAACRRRRL